MISKKMAQLSDFQKEMVADNYSSTMAAKVSELHESL